MGGRDESLISSAPKRKQNMKVPKWWSAGAKKNEAWSAGFEPARAKPT